MQRIWGWLVAVVIVTIVFGTVYLTLQHTGRQAVNDAPAAAAAAQIQQIDSYPAGPRLELTKDSGTFIIVYGEDNKPVFTTVTLHGEAPNLPVGVLDTTRTAGADAVTWQPEPALRMAVVTRQVSGKVVVAGQSLTLFESSDKATQLILTVGWFTSMLVLGAGYAVTAFLLQRRRPDPGDAGVGREV